jgi:hypothetical protein
VPRIVRAQTLQRRHREAVEVHGTATGYEPRTVTFSAKSARSVQDIAQRRFVHVPAHVDEEGVLPQPVCAGRDSMRFMLTPRRDSGFEHLEQARRLIAHEHHQRGAVVARRRKHAAADHQEARRVVRTIFDGAGDYLQAVHMRRVLAGDRRGVVGIAARTRGFGVARHRQLLRVGTCWRNHDGTARATARANTRVRCLRCGPCARAGIDARATRLRRRSSAAK